jgi:hypothetical protein
LIKEKEMSKSRTLLITILLSVVPLTLLSCGDDTPKTSNEVDAILDERYGVDFTFVSEENKNDREYIYTFTDPNGLEFTVDYQLPESKFKITYSSSYVENYIPARVIEKEAEIREDASKYNLGFEIRETGDIIIYIDSYKEIADASNLLKDIYNEVGRIKFKENNSRFITKELNISVEAKSVTSDRSSYTIFTQPFTKNCEYDTLADSIEGSYVSNVKSGIITEKIPDELWVMHPAKGIMLITCGNTNLDYTDYNLSYNSKKNTYTMDNLDVGLDYNNPRYNIPTKGDFKNLVEILGGKYSCRDNKATWTIGSNTWNAELTLGKSTTTDAEGYFRNIKISKNGEPIELSTLDGTNSGAYCTRVYTIEDLEKILDVTVEIDQ